MVKTDTSERWFEARVVRGLTGVPQQVIEIRRVEAVGVVRAVHAIGRTDDAHVPARTKRRHPRPQRVDDDVARAAQLGADVARRLEHRDLLLTARGNAGEVRHRQQFFLSSLRALIHFAKKGLGALLVPVFWHSGQPAHLRLPVVRVHARRRHHAPPTILCSKPSLCCSSARMSARISASVRSGAGL